MNTYTHGVGTVQSVRGPVAGPPYDFFYLSEILLI